jgi:hypothetical protein
MRRRIFGTLLFVMASLVAFGQTANSSDPAQDHRDSQQLNREAVQTKVDARSDVNGMVQDRAQLNAAVKASDKAEATTDAKDRRQDKRDVSKDKQKIKHDKQKIKQDKRQSSQIRANPGPGQRPGADEPPGADERSDQDERLDPRPARRPPVGST